MSMKSFWSGMLLLGTLVTNGTAARAQEPATYLTLDEEFALIAEQVPGFGGLYLDEGGVTHVYLTDLSRAREVQDLGEQVVVRQADYDFRDLLAWKSEVRGLLDAPGALFLDIDEQRNRLLFGVQREDLAAFSSALAVYLRNTRVPQEAVIVEAAEPIVTHEQLTDNIRPVPGGVQISRVGSTCTLGVNATRLSSRGFVTNSHCTVTRGIVDGTVAFQPTVSPGNQIGVETVDPAFFTGGSCPSNRRCRTSDAAFFAYDNNGLTAGGAIVNPLLCGMGSVPGPLATNPIDPRLPVKGFMLSNPVSGTSLTKVGRTTGCTRGTLKNTCADSNVLDPSVFPGVSLKTDITMLCQNQVAALSQGGDSGSPVFRSLSNGATVVGLLWGGNGESFAYSPWSAVSSEIGGFVTPEMN